MHDFKLFEYAGPPRTGTTWIIEAAHLCGLRDGQKAAVHIPFEGKTTKLRVMTVRHPCTWLASYWAEIHPGQISVAIVDQFAKLPGVSFDEFIRSYLEQMPGGIGRMIEHYGADSCLRIEDTPQNWIELMTSYKIPRVFSERTVDLEIRNRAKRRPLPKWNRSLRDRVLDAEVDMLERFEYWD